jgi:Leucine-rich repeat (LRR) protein
MTTLDLSNRKYSSIDIVIRKDVETINLSFNNLETLKGLKIICQVKNLLANNNKITEIDEILCTSLVHLNLAFNNFSTNENLQYFTKLAILNYSRNNIDVLLFDNIPITLEELDISFNSIHTIPFSIPSSFEFLKKINLSSNELTTLSTLFNSDTINQFPLLDTLTCSENKIKSFENTLLPNSLTTLYMDNNKIGSLYNFVFPKELRNFYCNDNDITTFEYIDFPENLKEFIYFRNPLIPDYRNKSFEEIKIINKFKKVVNIVKK